MGWPGQRFGQGLRDDERPDQRASACASNGAKSVCTAPWASPYRAPGDGWARQMRCGQMRPKVRRGFA
ncbi:hypothetical protein BZM27_34120 [Paraburkholderia steynii]|uniref:Uncharacterized protein n=1 Tax=Paraburkholderia steynii TaxID=1245441 RepID=A0A4R0XE83_9BURK|nr:hypothetical protein BZM27_34120 [Paraburkholderia steynii]